MKRLLLILTFILVLGAIFAGSAAAQDVDTTSLSFNPVPYVVQPGDSLSKIAFQYCTIWQDIYRYNQGTIGPDPNRISPGMVLYVSDRCNNGTVYDRGPMLHASGVTNGQFYIVAPGDTLYSVGQRFGLNYKIIMLGNDMTSTAVLEPGTWLYIPGFKEGQALTSVTITSPQDGDVYRLPYTVSGTSQGLEASLLIVRLLDGSGNLMQQQQTSVQKDGTWYAGFYNVVGQPKSNGSIEAFSPETGATDVVYFLFSGY